MAFQTTIKVALLTGAAKDDYFTTESTDLSEDMLQAFLNVLGNDPGSAQLYSLQQNLTDTDQMMPVQTATSDRGATITINEDGTVDYNAMEFASSFAHLVKGQFETDTFFCTVRMANGAFSTALVTLQIAGENDAPTLSSAPIPVSVDTPDDDTPDAVIGSLVGHDDDDGAVLTYRLTGAVINSEGNTVKHNDYGTLILNSSGGYSFLADPDKIDTIPLDQEVDVTFNVTVTDEHDASISQDQIFRLIGANDIPVIQDGGVTTADIYELAGSDPGANGTKDQFKTGIFVVKDLDLTDILTINVKNVSSAPRGELTASFSDTDAVGNWTVNWYYKYTDAALNSLKSGVPTTESFEIQISDATETVNQSIDLSLYGANEQIIEEGEEYVEVVELANRDPNENNFLHEIGGTGIQTTFTSMSWIADPSNTQNLGNFEAELTSTGMAIEYFSIEDKYLDYLLEGESLTQKFLVTLSNESFIFINTIIVELKGSSDENVIVDPAGVLAGTFDITNFEQGPIYRGLDGNDNFSILGENNQVYGDDGNDSFYFVQLGNSLIRGGNGDDIFTIDTRVYGNEIYGDNGNDLFKFIPLSSNEIWGGSGTDTYQVTTYGRAGSTPVLQDFDFRDPDAGGDWIDLTFFGDSIMNLALTQSDTAPDQYLLGGDVDGSPWTFFTIIGTNLAMTDLADNLVVYTV